jgi:hypothetical protein
MDAHQLRFFDAGCSNLNIGIDALKTQLRKTVDSANQQVWNFVGRGIGIPGYGEDRPKVALDVRDDQSPAILIADARDRHISTSTQFIDTEVQAHLSLYCFLNVLGSDAGSYPDIQELKRDITRATLRTLRPVTEDNLNGWPDPALIRGQFPYWIEEPTAVDVDYDDDLRNRFEGFSVEPPWWAWRIDIILRATNI